MICWTLQTKSQRLISLQTSATDIPCKWRVQRADRDLCGRQSTQVKEIGDQCTGRDEMRVRGRGSGAATPTHMYVVRHSTSQYGIYRAHQLTEPAQNTLTNLSEAVLCNLITLEESATIFFLRKRLLRELEFFMLHSHLLGLASESQRRL